MTVYVKTQSGSLNLRQGTSTSTSVLAQIPQGTELEVDNINDTWVKVTYKDKTGYVMSKYLAQTTTKSEFNKADLQKIYDNLKTTLSLIENLLK